MSGTVIGRFSAVGGSVVVASTTPGRMPPTGEPIPGKLSAGPKLPLLGWTTGGPSCALKPGKPNCWTNLSRCQTKRSGGTTNERELNEWLIVQRTKYGGTRERSYVWPRRRQDDGRRTAQHCATEQLGVRKIEAGKILRIVTLIPR